MKKNKFNGTFYYPHSLDIKNRDWSQNYVQFVSIDPAVVNFAICIERHYPDKIENILFERKSFKMENKSEIFKNINQYLNLHIESLKQSHYILIEKQLSKNIIATKVSQHVLSYFHCMLCDSSLLPSIVEISSKMKSIIICPNEKLNSREIKKRSIVKAIEILEERKDEKCLLIIKKEKKKDDLADCVCQIMAFIKYNL
jgi:hypothetical protein